MLALIWNLRVLGVGSGFRADKRGGGNCQYGIHTDGYHAGKQEDQRTPITLVAARDTHAPYHAIDSGWVKALAPCDHIGLAECCQPS